MGVSYYRYLFHRVLCLWCPFRHLHRLDQELAAIATVNGLPHRHGRQYSSREDALLSTIAKERELFEGAGFREYVRTYVYIRVHSCHPVCSMRRQKRTNPLWICILTQYLTTHRHSTRAVVANASTVHTRRPLNTVCTSHLSALNLRHQICWNQRNMKHSGTVMKLIMYFTINCLSKLARSCVSYQ